MKTTSLTRRLLVMLVAAVLAVGGLLAVPHEAYAAKGTYTVKYNANGGTGKMANQAIKVGKSTKLRPATFTRSGHAFTGWTTKKNGSGKAYKDQAKVKNLAKKGKKVTLYAQWRAYKPYAVSFDANGGAGTMSKQNITYSVATALTANAFTRAGWAFTGWNTKANGSGVAYANAARVTNLAGEGGAVTLYAQWRATDYTVNYDANGGAGSMESKMLTAGKVAKLSACAFTREGYRFAGWNTAADGSGDAYDNKEVIVSDLTEAGTAVTLYAQWEATTYAVAFDANGGTGTMAPKTVTVGKSYRLTRNAFTREGFEFVGWNTAADGSGDEYADREVIVDEELAPAGGSVTLYAQWEAVEPAEDPLPTTYTIAFDANGGSGEMAGQIVTAGKAFRLAKCAFTREGFEFVGWTTDAGEALADQYVVVDDLTEAGGSVTLRAQWQEETPEPKPETYAVAYDANGGTGTMGATTVTIGNAFKLTRCAFTREGFEFTGWNTEADGSGVAYIDREYVVDEDLAPAGGEATLYAQWRELAAEPVEPGTYTVTYDANGGEGEMADQTATAGKVFRLARCTFEPQANYAFAGWNTAADGSGEQFADHDVVVDDLAEADETVTLYAQWNAVSVTITFDLDGGTTDEPLEPMVSDWPGFDLSQSDSMLAGLKRDGYLCLGWELVDDGGATEASVDNMLDIGTWWCTNVSGLLLGTTVKIRPLWAEAATLRLVGGGLADNELSVNRSESLDSYRQIGLIEYSYYWFLDPEHSQPLEWGYTDEGGEYHYYTFDDLFPGANEGVLYWTDSDPNQPDDPGTDDPGTDDPGTDDPGTDDPTTYTVTYDANGGEGEMADQTATVGKAFKLVKNAFTRENYEFVGWNTAADGSGDAYDDKEVMLDDLAAAGETVTLYAQWNAVSVTVTFDLDGGTTDEPLEPMVFNSTKFHVDNGYQDDPFQGLSKEGFVFTGWQLVESEATDGIIIGEWHDYPFSLPSCWWDYTISNVPLGTTITLRAKWDEALVVRIVGGGQQDTLLTVGRHESVRDCVEAQVLDDQYWYLDPECTEPLELGYTGEDGEQHDRTFDDLFPGANEGVLYWDWGYAKARLDFNGGVSDGSVDSVVNGDWDGSLSLNLSNYSGLTKEGFVLTGWELADDGGLEGVTVTNSDEYSFGSRYCYIYGVPMGKIITLRALWSEAVTLRVLSPDGTTYSYRDVVMGKDEKLVRYLEPGPRLSLDPAGRQALSFYSTFDSIFPGSSEGIVYIQS